MCFVLNLGRYVFVPILTEWIDLAAFGLLDSSICNHKWREVFGSAVMAFSSAFQRTLFFDIGQCCLSTELLHWVYSRNIDYTVLSDVILSNQYMSLSPSNGDFGCIGLGLKRAAVLGCSEKNVSVLLSMILTMKTLETIILEHCNFRTSEIIWCLSQQCHCLRQFHLVSHEGISSVILIDLCRLNPNLTELVVTLRNVNRHFCFALAVHCRQLQVIDIVAPASSTTAFTALLLYCAKCLTKLSWNHMLTVRQTAMLLHSRGSTLRVLDLSKCRVATAIQMGIIWPQITELNFSKYFEEFDDAYSNWFDFYTQKSRTLLSLNTEEYPIADEQLCNVAKHCHLQRLAVAVGSLSEQGFCDLIHLRELTLEGESSCIGSILNTVGLVCKQLTKCDLLISSTNIDSEFENFLKRTTDSLTSLFVNYFSCKERGLLAVARHCRQLRCLKVRNFNGNCDGLKEAVKCCRRIQSLVLTPFVSTATIDAISMYGVNLTDLNISEARLHMDSLKRLVRQLPRLKVLRAMLPKEHERTLLSVNENLVILSPGWYLHE